MNAKIISFLKTLKHNETKELKKFLASPYFSTGRDLTKYYGVLIKYYPEFNVTKEEVFKDYFGKTAKFEEKKWKIIRALNSDLIKACEEYFGISTFQKYDYFNAFIRADYFLYRGLHDEGERVITDYMKDKKGLTPGHEKYMQLNQMLSTYLNLKSFKDKQREIYEISKEKADYLLLHFLGETAALSNSLKTNSNLFNVNGNELLSTFIKYIDFDKFLDEIPDGNFEYEKLKLKIYFTAISTRSEAFEKYKTKLLDSFKILFDYLEEDERTTNFVFILNTYTVFQTKETVKLKFDLIKFTLERNLFPSPNFPYLAAYNYIVFMITGLHVGEIEWTKKFCEEYIDKVNPNSKENLNYFSEAYIKHYEKDYLNSLSAINKIEFFKDETMANHMKLLQLKNYYELLKQSDTFFDNINYSIDAFIRYQNTNKKVSEKFRENGKNFVKGLRLLIKYTIADNNNAKDDILIELNEFLPATKNLWLINKIEEIMNEKQNKLITRHKAAKLKAFA